MRLRKSTVNDPEVLARIESLVIPPAWKNVWISPYPNGHIRAVGTAAASTCITSNGRLRGQEKYDRAVSLAKRLRTVNPAA
jgi:DNA topoisomerase I